MRLWGQYFTEAVWDGVLGALRAAPAGILGGVAGAAAGVPRLLNAFLDLIAMQVSGGSGCPRGRLGSGASRHVPGW